MKENSSKFERKKELALRALLTEPTLEAAAKITGISEVTLWRWLKDKEFAEAYREVKKEAVGQAVAKLQQASGEAVETLRTVMNDVSSPANTRVTAAKSIIEMALKAVEFEEIIKRVEELEEIANEQKETK